MKHQISKIGLEMLEFQRNLAKERNYQPIKIDLFLGDVRQKYRDNLPEWCLSDIDTENCELETTAGTVIAAGFNRIVIGDYGAFIEISKDQIIRKNIKVKEGQEYRYAEERYAQHVKYLWLTAKDNSDCKIYYQKKTVDYADYIPEMFYISPYEVFPKI